MSILHLVLLAGYLIGGIPQVRANAYQVQCLSEPYDSTVYARSRYTYTSYLAYVEYPDGILLSTNTTNDVLKLEFRYVEFGHVCSTSYIKVYEGQSRYGKLLKRFCGTKGQDILSTGQYVFVEYTSEQTDRRFQLSCQSIPGPSDASSKTKGIAGGVVAVVVAVCIVVGGACRYKRGPFSRKNGNRCHRNNTQLAATPPTTNVTNINTPVAHPADPSTHPAMQYNSYPPNAQYQPQSQHQYPLPNPYPVQAASQYQPQNYSQDLYPPAQPQSKGQPHCPSAQSKGQPHYPPAQSKGQPHYPPAQPQTQDLYPPSETPYAAQGAFPQQPTAPPMDPPPSVSWFMLNLI